MLDYDTPSISLLRQRLLESLRLRVLNVPEPPDLPSDIDTRVAILFSGGLDCTVLVRLVHDLIPVGQGIDLINVAFENPRQVAILAKQPNPPKGGVYESCPDRITGRKSFSELKSACSGRYIRFIAVCIGNHHHEWSGLSQLANCLYRLTFRSMKRCAINPKSFHLCIPTILKWIFLLPLPYILLLGALETAILLMPNGILLP